MDMEWTPTLNHHYPFKGQPSYTSIHVCIFVNTIQKDMEIDTEMDMDEIPLSTTTTPYMGLQANTFIYVNIYSYFWTNSSGDGDGYRDGYGVDPPLKHQYPIKCQQVYAIINILCIYEHSSEVKMDME